MRLVEQSAGRSINLALSKRGINALKDIGAFEKIKPMIMPMVGRMIHESDGSIHLQKYGQKSSEVIYSCLLYTSPSPRDLSTSRMPSSA